MVNKTISWLWFMIHMLMEVVCFHVLYGNFYMNGLIFEYALLYDFIAFVPQGLVGLLYERYPKLNLGIIGFILMFLGVIVLSFNSLIGLILISIGNSFEHEAGAYATVNISEEKLFPAALFVSGGSFGVVCGQYLQNINSVLAFRIICLFIMLILILYAQRIEKEIKPKPYKFDLLKENVSFEMVILITLFVVTARSYIGYCIPISWKKEVWQAFLLFFVMGMGKAIGGYFADKFGVKKIAISSTLLCIPFLIFGKDYMIISIIGIFLFSMTMSITFGMFLSLMNTHIGPAFGLTTIGLFLGTLPVFVFGQLSPYINMVIVVILSLISCLGLSKTLK